MKKIKYIIRVRDRDPNSTTDTTKDQNNLQVYSAHVSLEKKNQISFLKH